MQTGKKEGREGEMKAGRQEGSRKKDSKLLFSESII